MQSTTIRTKNGFAVGVLKGNLFEKRATLSKHLFRKLDAWGCDYDILFDQLPEKGVVRIYEQEEKKIYQVPVKVWRDEGQVLHFKEGTEDHNMQVFLPRSYFMVTAPFKHL